MSAVRSLGAIYLATASVFGVAIALSQHPDWERAATATRDSALQFAAANVVHPVTEAGRQQLVRFYDSIDPQVRIAARTTPRAAMRVAAIHDTRVSPIERQIDIDNLLAKKREADVGHMIDVPRTIAAPPPLKPVITEDLPQVDPATPTVAPSRPELAFAAPKQAAPALNSTAPHLAPLPPTELSRVLERLKQNLTPEMVANFELFLYVSKAEAGPWAQHMYVFSKDDVGNLALQYNWPVSTGREKVEFNDAGVRLPTFTPQGYYELDPDRLYRHYTSSQWHQPMPFAMFFNYVKDGYQTGLAIHAAHGDDIALLGKRASAGCVRLSPENAQLLFSLIKAKYRGLAPRFAIDHRTGTMSRDGILLHDANGNVRTAEGYKVLIFIENYGGQDNVVAALF